MSDHAARAACRRRTRRLYMPMNRAITTPRTTRKMTPPALTLIPCSRSPTRTLRALPILRTDVGAVPSVRVLRGRAQGAFLAAPSDPDRDARLQRLRIVRRVGDLEVLAFETRAALLGVEEHAHDLRVFLEHVFARA